MIPDIDDLPRALLEWFEGARRDMPWRRSPDPYRVWVSEVMLQQTRVDAVVPYFERWMRRFPDLDALAGADLDEVLAEWEGLGYYSRARNLHAAVRVVRDERETLIELELTPGRANRARLGRSPLTRPRDVLGTLRTVLFAPEDLALVKGDPSERRRFLDDLLVAFQQPDLPVDLEFDGPSEKSEGVEVLDLGACAERVPCPTHRYVGVAAERAFFHASIADARVHQHLAEPCEIGHGLVGGTKLRLGDDLDERDSSAVEIDER